MNLRRVFALQLEILGTIDGHAARSLRRCSRFSRGHGVRPMIDSVHPFERVRDAFARLHSGDVFGKVVVEF